ncbi:hypothetical protein DQ04_01791070 [Trypanosoma grayi]|uniref:hypothetical protein n=1 Tax=Trypanosoma grayi TaxID=71804 RepID=UPI0004F47DA6|nr:hypothetical protein DQ04_01791070 [Trypanosoma grayi]KEG12335.1 hypothetical protein DQ04_01791070 [Trypanosoma grayi]
MRGEIGMMRTLVCRVALCVVALTILAAPLVAGQVELRDTPVAPNLLEPMDPTSQQYLIGVVSFFVFIVAAFLGVRALMNVDYSDDTLLMVEVAETANDK